MKYIANQDNVKILVRHGKGKQKWLTGEVYEGEWREDKMNGYGKFIHGNNDLYEGYFIDDKANG